MAIINGRFIPLKITSENKLTLEQELEIIKRDIL